MSRIHDALKKATEEKASQSPASPAQTFVDGREGISRFAQARNEVGTAPKNGSGNSVKQPCVRFEQLLKRCAHPQWTLDPAGRTFGRPDSREFVAGHSR